MKSIIYNEDNLNIKDINNYINRSKALIINEKNEILLAFTNNGCHLVGGHVEEHETFLECLIREIKEETGQILTCNNIKFIMDIDYLCKNYPNNKNTLYVTKYYLVKENIVPNLNELNLTKSEKNMNFNLKYININEVINILEELEQTCKDTIVVRDTIDVIKYYISINKEISWHYN